MAKLIAFDTVGYRGMAKEYQSNDPDLTLNGDDFVLSSAIVVNGSWSLYPEVGYEGLPISLNPQGGPDTDGCYKDYADWSGTGQFHVKSIMFH